MVSQSVANLEAELKLLRWHKLANESALKAAILKNKQMKRKEKNLLQLPYDINVRMDSIVGEERAKELIIDESFVREHQERELRDEAYEKRRLTVQTKRLTSIHKKLEDIELARSRKLKCSSMRHLLQIESHSDIGNENTSRSRADEKESDIEHNEDKTISGHSKSPSVHDRISTISKQLMRPNTVERTKLHFSKYQTRLAGEPARSFYSVRMSKGDVDEAEVTGYS